MDRTSIMADPSVPQRRLATPGARLPGAELEELDDAPAGDPGNEPPPAPVPIHRFPVRLRRSPWRAILQEYPMPPNPPLRPNSPGSSPSSDGHRTHSPEPELLADADVALLAETGTPAPRPPPLPPKNSAGDAPALPAPGTDSALSASPSKAPAPDPIALAGNDWEKVVAGAPALPESRTDQPRPPPVLPQVAPPASVPRTLAPMAPTPRPTAPPACVPWTAAEDDEEPSFTPGPPSMADVLFGGAPAVNTFIAGERQVVIHTREGRALRGSIRDVDLKDSTLPLETRGGTVRVPNERVRAVFFVVPIGGTLPEPRGRRAEVVLEDGRPLPCAIEDHHHEDPGFFLTPLQNRGRTERIYVYREAIRSISFA